MEPAATLPRGLERYFSDDPLLHIELIESLRHGHGHVIDAGARGVLIRHGRSGLYMLSATEPAYGDHLVSQLPDDTRVLHVCQEWLADLAMAKRGLLGKMTCHKLVYLKKTPLVYEPRLRIRRTVPEEAGAIIAHYDLYDPDGLRETIRAGRLWSGYLGEQFVGFIGRHGEGSMGFLHVFEPYRQQGYAVELESFLTNLVLARGEVPRGDVIVGNEASLRLQKKLGFQEASGLVCWVFGGET